MSGAHAASRTPSTTRLGSLSMSPTLQITSSSDGLFTGDIGTLGALTMSCGEGNTIFPSQPSNLANARLDTRDNTNLPLRFLVGRSPQISVFALDSLMASRNGNALSCWINLSNLTDEVGEEAKWGIEVLVVPVLFHSAGSLGPSPSILQANATTLVKVAQSEIPTVAVLDGVRLLTALKAMAVGSNGKFVSGMLVAQVWGSDPAVISYHQQFVQITSRQVSLKIKETTPSSQRSVYEVSQSAADEPTTLASSLTVRSPLCYVSNASMTAFGLTPSSPSLVHAPIFTYEGVYGSEGVDVFLALDSDSGEVLNGGGLRSNPSNTRAYANRSVLSLIHLAAFDADYGSPTLVQEDAMAAVLWTLPVGVSHFEDSNQLVSNRVQVSLSPRGVRGGGGEASQQQSSNNSTNSLFSTPTFSDVNISNVVSPVGLGELRTFRPALGGVLPTFVKTQNCHNLQYMYTSSFMSPSPLGSGVLPKDAYNNLMEIAAFSATSPGAVASRLPLPVSGPNSRYACTHNVRFDLNVSFTAVRSGIFNARLGTLFTAASIADFLQSRSRSVFLKPISGTITRQEDNDACSVMCALPGKLARVCDLASEMVSTGLMASETNRLQDIVVSTTFGQSILSGETLPAGTSTFRCAVPILSSSPPTANGSANASTASTATANIRSSSQPFRNQVGVAIDPFNGTCLGVSMYLSDVLNSNHSRKISVDELRLANISVYARAESASNSSLGAFVDVGTTDRIVACIPLALAFVRTFELGFKVPSTSWIVALNSSIIDPDLPLLSTRLRTNRTCPPTGASNTYNTSSVADNVTPFVEYISGCIDAFPSTGACRVAATDKIAIHGRNLHVVVGVELRFYTAGNATMVSVPCNCSEVLEETAPNRYYLDCTVSPTGPQTRAHLVSGIVYHRTSTSNTFLPTPSNMGRPTPTISFASPLASCVNSNAPHISCTGHGDCIGGVECACYSNGVEGYWAGTFCDMCSSGWMGTGCDQSCGGETGSCDACTGHGVCGSNNATDVLTCTCDAGWHGARCDECAAGFYGLDCTFSCPASASGAICSGHGSCDSGQAGTGKCICEAGFDGGVACGACSDGFMGYPSCTSLCGRDTVVGAVCSGHGTCGDQSQGTCLCQTGFTGSRCELACPIDALGVMCGGHGRCISSSNCSCDSFYAQDPKSGLCTVCSKGYYGANCANTCLPCNFGTCDEKTGSCKCGNGFWGPSCSRYCPGTSPSGGQACSGHGTCSPSTGTCTCYSSPKLGFYVGDQCNSCLAGYESAGCLTPCPTFNGVACNSRGTCFNGTCSSCTARSTDPSPFVCGYSCQLFGRDTCFPPATCPDGFWGPSCSHRCPANPSTGVSCSGVGVCNVDSGVCACPSGFAGYACERSCPRNPVTGIMCSDAGACLNGSSAVNLVCSCKNGFAGGACEFECPSGPTSTGSVAPCSQHGTCSTYGTCECNDGWGGDACDVECPGGASSPCNFNGKCQSDASCICNSDSIYGHFFGAACDQCAFGWAGESCADQCSLAGTAQVLSRECVCKSGYGGEFCQSTCPVDPTTGIVCGLRGTCSTTQGNCVCAEGWFGPLCSKFCTPTECANQLGLTNPACGPLGQCQCVGNEEEGFFGGETCSDCATFYWGAQCTLPCPCNQHGSCDRDTGTCSCFHDSSNGFWDGPACDACEEGYIGENCQRPNVELNSATPSFLLRQAISTPPRSLLIFDAATKAIVSFVWANSASTEGTLSTGTAISRDTPAAFVVGATLIGKASRPLLNYTEEVAVFRLENGTAFTLSVQQIRLAVQSSDDALITKVSSSSFTDRPVTSSIVTLLPQSLAFISTFPPSKGAGTPDSWTIALNNITDVTPMGVSAASTTPLSSATPISFYSGAAISGYSWRGPEEEMEGLLLVGSTLVPEQVVQGRTIPRSLKGMIAIGSVLAGSAVYWDVVMDVENATAVSACAPRSIPAGGGVIRLLVPCAFASPSGAFIRTLTIETHAFNAVGRPPFITTIAEQTDAAYLSTPQRTSSAIQLACTAMVLDPLLVEPNPLDKTACKSFQPSSASQSSNFNWCFDFGYVACGPAASSGTSPYSNLYKFSLTTNQVHSKLVVPRQVTSMASDFSDGILYIVQFGDTLTTLNTFGVQQVSPALADSSGGTPLSLRVEGLLPSLVASATPNSSPLQLRCAMYNTTNLGEFFVASDDAFGNGRAILSVQCRSTLIHSSSSCAKVPVDVILRNGRRTTVKATPTALLMFAPTVQLSAAGSVAGVSLGSAFQKTSITLTGLGFVVLSSSQKAHATPQCRLVNPATSTSPVLDVVGVMPAVAVGFNSAVCAQGVLARATTPGAVIQYSHDGTIFSAGIVYVAAGFASKYAITNTDAQLVVTSGKIAVSPAVTVKTLDSLGNSLLSLDTVPQRLRVTFLYRRRRSTLPSGAAVPANTVIDDSTVIASASTVGMSESGVWVAPSLEIYYPMTGYGSVMLEDMEAGSLVGRQTYDVRSVSVIAGLPAAIVAASPTAVANLVIGVAAATNLPSLEFTIADVAGNQVAYSKSLPTQLSLTLPFAVEKTSTTGPSPSPKTTTATVSRQMNTQGGSALGSMDEKPFTMGTSVSVAIRGTTNSYTFTDGRARAYFSEIGFSITVSVLDDGGSGSTFMIPPLVIPNVALQMCTTDEFAVLNSFACEPCPEHAVCDGGYTVDVAEGYWRASGLSLAIYQCPRGSCTEQSQCDAGYTGPKCSVCSDGYGLSGGTCKECLGTTADTALSIFYCFALFVLVLFMTISSLRPSLTEPSRIRSLLTIVLKTIISHGQLVTLVLSVYPATSIPYASNLLLGGGSATTLSPNLSFMSCSLFPTAYRKFEFFGGYGPVAFIAAVSLVAIALSPFVLFSKLNAGRSRLERRLEKQLAQQQKATGRRLRPGSLSFSGIGGSKKSLDNSTVCFSRSMDQLMRARQAVYIHIDSPSEDEEESDDLDNEPLVVVPAKEKMVLNKNNSSRNTQSINFSQLLMQTESTRRTRARQAGQREPSLQNFRRSRGGHLAPTTASSRRISESAMNTTDPETKHASQRLLAEKRLAKLLQFEHDIPSPRRQPSETRSFRADGALREESGGSDDNGVGEDCAYPSSFNDAVGEVVRPRSQSRSSNIVLLSGNGNGEVDTPALFDLRMPSFQSSNGVHHPGEVSHQSPASNPSSPYLGRCDSDLRVSFGNSPTTLANNDSVAQRLNRWSFVGESLSSRQQLSLPLSVSNTSGRGYALQEFSAISLGTTPHLRTIHPPPSLHNNYREDLPGAHQNGSENEMDSLLPVAMGHRHQDLAATKRTLWRRCCYRLPRWVPYRRVTPLTIVQCVAVAALVVLFYFYPTTIATSAALFPCETIDSKPVSGSGTSGSYLSADLSISCDGPEHDTFKQRAVVSILAYGLGTPLLMTIGVLAVTYGFFDGDVRLGCQLFYFTTAGFREERWFWEAVIMVRKALVVLAVTIPSDPFTKTLLVSWLLLAFIAVNAIARPFDDAFIGSVETASLVTLLISFSVLFMWPQMQHSDQMLVLGGVIILVANVLFLLLAVSVSGYILALVVKAWQAQHLSRLERRLEIAHNIQLIAKLYPSDEETREALQADQKRILEQIEEEESGAAAAANPLIDALLRVVSQASTRLLEYRNAQAAKLILKVEGEHPRSSGIHKYIINDVLKDHRVVHAVSLALVVTLNKEKYESGDVSLSTFAIQAKSIASSGLLWTLICHEALFRVIRPLRPLVPFVEMRRSTAGSGGQLLLFDSNDDVGAADATAQDTELCHVSLADTPLVNSRQSSHLADPKHKQQRQLSRSLTQQFVVADVNHIEEDAAAFSSISSYFLRTNSLMSSATGATTAVEQQNSFNSLTPPGTAEETDRKLRLLEHVAALAAELAMLLTLLDQASFRIKLDRKRGYLVDFPDSREPIDDDGENSFNAMSANSRSLCATHSHLKALFARSSGNLTVVEVDDNKVAQPTPQDAQTPLAIGNEPFATPPVMTLFPAIIGTQTANREEPQKWCQVDNTKSDNSFDLLAERSLREVSHTMVGPQIERAAAAEGLFVPQSSISLNDSLPGTSTQREASSMIPLQRHTCEAIWSIYRIELAAMYVAHLLVEASRWGSN